MRTLDRYIAFEFLRNFLIAALGLTFVLTFQALMGDLIDESYSFRQILTYNLLYIPQIFAQMTPPAVLMATVFTLSALNRNNELTALYSIGFGIDRIVITLLTLVFTICCLSIFMQDRVIPPFLKKRTVFYFRDMQKKTDFYFDFKKDKIWYRSNQLIYNLKTFDTKSNTILGMSVYIFDQNFDLAQVINASKAKFTPNGWKLLDGTVTVFVKEDPFPLTKAFEEKELVIDETPKDFQEIEKEVDGLRLIELKKYIDKVKNAGADVKGYLVKFHSRISLSLTPIIMCILGVPFSTRNRREGSIAKDFGLCMVVTFFYWLFYSIGLSLGTNGALLPWLAAWLPNFIFAAVAGVLVFRVRK